MVYVARFFKFRDGQKVEDRVTWVFLRFKTMRDVIEVSTGGKLTKLGDGWTATGTRRVRNGFCGYYVERRPFWKIFGWGV